MRFYFTVNIYKIVESNVKWVQNNLIKNYIKRYNLMHTQPGALFIYSSYFTFWIKNASPSVHKVKATYFYFYIFYVLICILCNILIWIIHSMHSWDNQLIMTISIFYIFHFVFVTTLK